MPSATTFPQPWGRYVLLEEIGTGATARVFRARPMGGGGQVALKVLKASRALDRKKLERFYREAQVVAQLRHPGILPVHDTGQEEGGPWIAYQLVYPAETLDDVFPQLDRDQRLDALIEVVEAIAYAHAQGVVHRDLKPENVLVHDGRCLVADFGLVWFEGAETLTRTGAITGTPRYMPPETLLGQRRPDKTADVWALGVMLYEALTDRSPFRDDSIFDLIRDQQRTPRSPRSVDSGVPAGFSAVCMKALQSSPERRYPDAGALAADLQRCRRGETPEARATIPLPRSPVGPVPLVLASLGLLGACGLATWAVLLKPDPQPTAAKTVARSGSAAPDPRSPVDPRPAMVEPFLAELDRRREVELIPRLNRLASTAEFSAPVVHPRSHDVVDRTLDEVLLPALKGGRWTLVHSNLLDALANTGLWGRGPSSDRFLDELHLQWRVTGQLPTATYVPALTAATVLNGVPLFEHLVNLEAQVFETLEGPVGQYLGRLNTTYRTSGYGGVDRPERGHYFLRKAPAVGLSPRNAAQDEACSAVGNEPRQERLKRLARSAEQDPASPWVRLAQAELESHEKRADRAAALVEEALPRFLAVQRQRKVQIGNMRAYFYGRIARVLVRIKANARAVELLESLPLTAWEKKTLEHLCRRLGIQPSLR